MPAVWPLSLPQRGLARGYTEIPDPNATIRSPVEVGPAKLRPRYSVTARLFTIPLVLDVTQLATLDAFWESTLAFGSLPFDWIHMRTLAAYTYQFRAYQEPQVLSGRRFRVELALETYLP
jgi:hypothetical protein